MSHVVMPKKLAHALMEAGMQHFDFGGAVKNPLGSDAASYLGPGAGATPGGMSLAGGSQNFGPQNLNGGNIFGGGDGPPKIMGMSPMSNFNATMPQITQQQFLPQIGLQQGNLSNVYAQQQSLANMLLQQSQGGGPGQALVAQQAGNNAAQQGALMSSVRGASSNPAAIARQAAMAGQAGNQQALNTQAALALQSQGALGAQQAGMAGESLQAQQILQNAQAAQNQAITQGSLGVQNINAGTQAANAKTTAGIFGGASSGAGAALASFLAYGGKVPGKMLAGGDVPGKAKVPGDSKDNDTVPTLLSPGEIVIPRSIAQSPDRDKKTIEFLHHLKSGGYSKVAEARRKKK